MHHSFQCWPTRQQFTRSKKSRCLTVSRRWCSQIQIWRSVTSQAWNNLISCQLFTLSKNLCSSFSCWLSLEIPESQSRLTVDRLSKDSIETLEHFLLYSVLAAAALHATLSHAEHNTTQTQTDAAAALYSPVSQVWRRHDANKYLSKSHNSLVWFTFTINAI